MAEEASLKRTVFWPDRSGLPAGVRRANKRQVTMRPFTFTQDWEAVKSPMISTATRPDVQEASDPVRERQDPAESGDNEVAQRSESETNFPSVPSPSTVVATNLMRKTPTPRVLRRSPRHSSTSGGETSPVGQRSTTEVVASPISQSSTPGQLENIANDSIATGRIPETQASVSMDNGSLQPQEESPASDANIPNEATDLTPDQNLSQASSASKNKSPARRRTRFRTPTSAGIAMEEQSSQPSASQPETSASRKTSTVKQSTRNTVSKPSMTPKSTPVVSRKRQKERVSSEDADKTSGHVRMWTGSGRHRTLADLTDLDVILNMVEEVTLDYRESVESKACKRGINEFFIQFKKTITDYIDLSQEHRLLRSAVSRNAARTRQLRKTLLNLRLEDKRLDEEIAIKKHRLEENKDHRKAMEEISDFQTNLQDLFQEYSETMVTSKQRDTDYNCPSNLTGLVRDVGNTLQTVTSLRSTNNTLQQWLDSH
ncbi:centromere protein U-like [Ptychodera flava]|uniref:centromere protein U-like n=1 Tax=Ptychodera flava TaxID=63121 RepID=UPI003969EE7E